MKKLIAAAVAAAVIAPASVLAAGPTLYGKLHVSVDGIDNNGKSSDNTQYDEWSLQSNSSRIGVKGSEDLGNGMKVGYLIEWGVDMDGDGGDLSERNRAVTLSGDWGTALAGKWDTPFKTTGRKLDLFGDRIGDTRNLSKFGTTENRAKNVAAYVTPNMNGFSATVAYVFDAGTGNLGGAEYSDDNSDNNAWSFNAIYKNGPILAVLGYVDYSDDGRAQTVTTTSGGFSIDQTTGATVGTPLVSSTSSTNSDNASAWRAGGAYTFGDFKVIASYTDFESQNFVKDYDTSMWTLGGSYKMGSNTIKLQYSDLDDSDLKTCGTTSMESCKDGADMWTVGLDHAMSKRTTVYAAYSTTDNNDDSARTTWASSSGHGATASAVTGEDADAFSVGIIHKF